MNLGELKDQIETLIAAHPEYAEAPVTYILSALAGGLEAGQGKGYDMVAGVSVEDFKGRPVVTIF